MQDSEPKLLRWEEAVNLLRSVADATTNQLMNMANFEVMRRVATLKEFPVASFDMQFFMEVMRSFCSKHENLRKVLAGEDLRLFSDEDS